MPGHGVAPKDPNARRRRAAPARGEYTSSPEVGWQHGPVPKPPDGILPVTAAAWKTWFAAWFAARWSPSDVPGLRVVALLYDQVERGVFARSTELRFWLAEYGVSPKGQQDRRWIPPKVEPVRHLHPVPDARDPYDHLRSDGGGKGIAAGELLTSDPDFAALLPITGRPHDDD